MRNLLFILFAISGLTGLIYESIWSHYLKLFLGHAAYAQVLVLVIFMGGMALGAYIAGRLTSNWINLLILYAIAEGVIGIFGVIFNPLFQTILTVSYDHIIPSLSVPIFVHVFKWTIGALLILPQSILLGMTFPLMSNGIIRAFPAMPGKSIAMLYFTNSIGAAIGVLFSGFYLLKTVGLPGTILTAGLLNITLALIVYSLAKKQQVHSVMTKHLTSSTPPYLILAAAFITGTASFIYEIAWVRMLSMVLGTSTHAFELMLSAFITGLAFGGLWIRRHIDSLANPIRTVGIVQIFMGLLALATLPLYNFSFDLMGFFMAGLDHTDEGYQLFTLSSHFVALLIMFPATFCAGMTLPLFTIILLNQGWGEKSIGQVYASNTLGAIVGIVFTIFIAMPHLGLKGAMLLGCSLDLGLGLLLLLQTMPYKNKYIVLTTTTCITAMSVTFFLTEFDFRKMTAAVYRTGNIEKSQDTKTLFHKDAKTSSINITLASDGTTSLSTNGKPDAAINMMDNEEISNDEPTMVLLAALPISIKPDAKTVANIGMGSGLTTHTLLAWPSIERVDTIEIESAIVEAANAFRPRVERAYTDPRSHIHIEDAKTYFSTHQKKYDIIISEPSNPWVSGISSLFTKEFYRHAKNYLTEDGIFVQWLQAYEINNQLVFSILKSVMINFSDFIIFAANDGDLIILAKDRHAIEQPQDIIFSVESMRKELSLAGINNIQDFYLSFVGDHKIFAPLINISNPPSNSDYFPILDLNAPRTLFTQENAEDFTRIRQGDPLRLLDMLAPDYSFNILNKINEGRRFSTGILTYHALQILEHSRNGESLQIAPTPFISKLELLTKFAETCTAVNHSGLWTNELFLLSRVILPILTPDQSNEIWGAITPECENGLTKDEQNWLGLVKALSQLDAESIAVHSFALFQQGNHWTLEQQRFQFASLLMALAKLNKYHDINLLREQHLKRLYQDETVPLGILILLSLTANNLDMGKSIEND